MAVNGASANGVNGMAANGAALNAATLNGALLNGGGAAANGAVNGKGSVTVSATVAGHGLAHHLLHRPSTAEGLMLGTVAPVPQDFTLSAALPDTHPLFNDGPGTFHDPHFAIEAMRQSVLFVAHQYFRVPSQRPVVLASTEVGITGLETWRRNGHTAHIAVDMALHPVDVVNGVPRGLRCEAQLSIDGKRCGTAKARTVFLMPKVYQNHRARGRAASRSERFGFADGQDDARPRPESVGRSDPHNVVISQPLSHDDDLLRVKVIPDAAHPVFTANATDHVPAVVLLEASRQAAFLAAGELHGFSAANCVLTEWNARFRGFAEIDLPLYCTAAAGPLGRDPGGHPAFPVTLTFTQGSREIATVAVAVLQDY
ncbi:MAG: AfsA-related hotdog domain-containing protein [Actinocrinis sp.]